MRPPLFNQIERQIMHENKSYFATRMRLHIAIKQFEKVFMKTLVGKFIQKVTNS